ncbi:hypothetical protein P22_0638 [Propionispora sp. 2/2-37]|uniref:transcriptional regulator GutM n=1 Tax=Propionispora sp. 2/2-37 TaxID=1677858 RepID=UPI0006BB6638|nr:transcriptional regulator GutM [Propionispora sp. 2/2-37]CUH94572.1 hypothetical protein P22_0638 [Propionispora sp. 2/2-37]
MWEMLLLAAGLWGLQGVLGFFQMRNFNGRFKALRQRGRVVAGRSKGRMVAGVVVLFCIDANGTILTGERMSGVSSFARFHPFPALQGNQLNKIDETICEYIRLDRQTTRAVLNAVDNYRAFIQANTTMEVIPAKTGALLP